MNPAVVGGDVRLPQPEQKQKINTMDVQVKRAVGSWQVWAGPTLLRDVGDSEMLARDVARVFRELRPTEWVTIGPATRPVVEYGLTNGQPPVAGAALPENQKGWPGARLGGAMAETGPLPAITTTAASAVVPIDLKTVRVEPIRGVWCVRDDNSLLFNFGSDQANAEQAVAVIHKYGFNRIGVVGNPTLPAMRYLFVSLDPDPPKVQGGPLLFNAQVEALNRTGIPVPGVGFVGEMIKIDPKKVTARKDGNEWVVAYGSEVLGRFGPTEWAAREAARTIQDARFTEFCKLGGGSDFTFFLKDGKPPTRAPFASQGRSFDRNALKVQPINGKWAVTENGRHLMSVGDPREGEWIVRIIQAYGFDQLAKLGSGNSTGGIHFLVKSR